MRNFNYTILLLVFIISSMNAQFPFEKYKAVKSNGYKWESNEIKDEIIHSCSVLNFYPNGETVSVKVRWNYEDENKKSEIIINRGISEETKVFFEGDVPFTPAGLEPLLIADFNGDGLKDIKITSAYMGCGIASLGVRIIYLFQKANEQFSHVSFYDFFSTNSIERDFDKDGNFEIITMSLEYYKNHNYWTFNIYNFKDDQLINVNYKANYPILVQYLFRDNYKITKNLTRQQMKKFEEVLPVEYFQEIK